MPFSHHSHSGQFCPGHARDSLEEVIQTAVSKRMNVFCLTEHMPRHDEDRYPEEIELGYTCESMFADQDAYYLEAVKLREKYKSQIQLPIGFEVDYCRPEAGQLIRRSLASHQFDLFIGSVHHVKTFPIDYDSATYEQARRACGDTDEDIFAAYYEEQYVMLQDLKPPIVGHFDLIRLKSDDPNGNDKSRSRIWSLMMRNLDFIASYGGLLEINSAALRKGMSEPYPKLEVCEAFRQRGGRFCLSDDSHGMDQIACCYDKVLEFLKKAQINEIHYFVRMDQPASNFDSRFPYTELRKMGIQEVQRQKFWTAVERNDT